MKEDAFLDRVMAHVPAGSISQFTFMNWSHGDKPTSEGVGLLPIPGADPVTVLSRVFDLDHYAGNIPHVVENRIIADPNYVLPDTVRFYQRIDIPLLGGVHHELVLERRGTIKGYEVARWHLLGQETEALSKKTAARSQYNDGAWLVAPGVVGYALSSAPKRDDVGFLKWKVLTAGADVAAANVVRENIEAMSKWAVKK